jgi:hypothetical protein
VLQHVFLVGDKHVILSPGFSGGVINQNLRAALTSLYTHWDENYWEEALGNLKRARDRVARRCNALRSEAVFRVGDWF